MESKKKCSSVLILDGAGDDRPTFYCDLEAGHEGLHMEHSDIISLNRWCMSWVDGPHPHPQCHITYWLPERPEVKD